jgi:hypothetical protein
MAKRRRKKKKVQPADKKPIDGIQVYINELFVAEKYDPIDIKHLYDDRYRVNCYKNGMMIRSHFVVYNDSGVMKSYPDLSVIGF